MKQFMYSVYDDTAKVYSQTFFSLNDATAQRVIKNAVAQPGHNYNMNPEDFSLYLVGEFDDNTGVITPLKEKKLDLITLKPTEE